MKEFSRGIPLCQAVRQARDRLEGLRQECPPACWLPVVCINPKQPDLIWYGSPLLRRVLSCLRRYRSIIFAITALALVVTLAVVIPPIQNENTPKPTPTITRPIPTTTPDEPQSIVNFISFGEKKLIPDTIAKLDPSSLLLKRSGINAFVQRDYQKAMHIFDQLHPRPQAHISDQVEDKHALKDPEILIYRNNALVRHRQRQNHSLRIYTIAVAAPLKLEQGRDILSGVAQAQDIVVNDKNPINLQVVIANDKNDPEQAGDIAEELSKNPNILAVIGHYASGTTCAALKVYDPNKLIIISPTRTPIH